MLFILSDGRRSANSGDEAGSEHPLLETKYGTADARDDAERLDLINSFAL